MKLWIRPNSKVDKERSLDNQNICKGLTVSMINEDFGKLYVKNPVVQKDAAKQKNRADPRQGRPAIR